MRNILSRDDAWKLVDPPSGTVAPTDPVEIEKLESAKKRALTLIALSVKDSVIPFIANISEPDKCWRVLRDLYANNTNTRKLMLRRKLAVLKMSESSTMSNFLQEVTELVNEFAAVGETIPDDELVEHILLALPDTFEVLVNTIMYREKLPKPSALIATLLQDEVRRNLRAPRRTEAEALLVKNAGRHSANRRSAAEGDQKIAKAGGNCHYCGQKGHWLRNCPELAAEVKRRRASRIEQPTVNLIDNFEIDEYDSYDSFPNDTADPDLTINFTEVNLACSKDEEWFLDSGASRHVTGRKNLLSNLEGGNHSRISTAGGERLHVAGQGSVDFPTTSGGIKLDEVLYVPGVTKNLISVGSITDGKQGLKVLFDSKSAWILRNSPAPDPCNVVASGRETN